MWRQTPASGVLYLLSAEYSVVIIIIIIIIIIIWSPLCKAGRENLMVDPVKSGTEIDLNYSNVRGRPRTLVT